MRTPLRPFALLALALAGAHASAIIGGTADTAGSVYQYMGTMQNGFSGTPIAPNWFVTARHTAPGIGTSYANPDGNFSVDAVGSIVNTNDPNGLKGFADLVVVHVTGGVFSHYYSYGQVPTGADPNANGTGGTNGTLTTLVGIGDHSTAIGFSPGGSIGRSTATNTVDGLTVGTFDQDPNNIQNSWAAYIYDLDDGSAAHNLTGSQIGTLREGGIANGDSGGGWFVNNGGALPMLIAVSNGVNSQGGATGSGSSNYWDAGGIGIGTDLGYYASQIQSYTGIGPVAFVTATPEPASLAALGVGALALLRRRRRS